MNGSLDILEISSASILVHEMIKENWSVLENVTEPKEILITRLENVSFLRDNEKYIAGKEMRHRAKEMGCNFGLQCADYLLEHQTEIPKKLQNYDLVLPGILLEDSGLNSRVLTLYCAGVRWYPRFTRLDRTWDDRDCFIRDSK